MQIAPATLAKSLTDNFKASQDARMALRMGLAFNRALRDAQTPYMLFYTNSFCPSKAHLAAFLKALENNGYRARYDKGIIQISW